MKSEFSILFAKQDGMQVVSIADEKKVLYTSEVLIYNRDEYERSVQKVSNEHAEHITDRIIDHLMYGDGSWQADNFTDRFLSLLLHRLNVKLGFVEESV